MPNGKEMLNELDFENKINELGENQLELIKFLARQQYTANKILLLHEGRIAFVEKKDTKVFGLVGGGAGFLGAIIAGICDYFLRR